ncbi:hypothetical protein SPI_03302 [Niveomyces insectorum RCEF 264]|uniref:Uncharacterized protein n=1 Tax=Niveomyces insectorum RCEF 264 TaxID=1081102 RepID=A0A167X8E7_9HYPO|nr:hypothetical protein SPI_03302 [Niveomyces insectorum RCEF 264]
MFGSMPIFATPLPPTAPPKNVPPPTPVQFPRYHPELTGDRSSTSPSSSGARNATTSGTSADRPRPRRKQPLTAILQSIVRPTEINRTHFEALGVHIHADAGLVDLVPDYHKVAPDFATWDDISYEDARTLNEATRRPISNGKQSPGIQTYLDRKRELSFDNNAAYRTVRRMQPLTPGQPPVRLGNAYEFYRHLENFSAFWDDTSMPPTPVANEEEENSSAAASSPSSSTAHTDRQPQGEDSGGDNTETSNNGSGDSVDDDASVSSTSSAAVTTDSESKPSSPGRDGPASVPEIRFYRTGAGSQMPSEFRINIVMAFLKLVAYDFGCNVSAPRMEPRLYLNAGTLPAEDAAHSQDPLQPQEQQQQQQHKQPSSYFASGCIFIFRSPTTREAARAGIVEGPLAAVSARHTTSFPGAPDAVDKESCIDLARELVAALLTAQHRAREGRAERRLGEGAWWTTKPRWGGGSGGPIGREVDAAPNTDDTLDTKAEGPGGVGSSSGSSSSLGVVSGSSSTTSGSGPAAARFSGLSGGGANGFRSLAGRPNLAAAAAAAAASSSGSTAVGAASAAGAAAAMATRGAAYAAKKPRKGLALYDNYRLVRPPSSSWDKKTRYRAIGRVRGVDYDDVFVVNALFHHLSVVRVRVPQRLLQALDGEDVDDDGDDDAAPSWGRLEVVRSPWYDFFQVQDRLAALRVVWAMLAYLMRADDEPASTAAATAAANEDVAMGNAT